ncbi:fasciclin domain-containing protein [Paradesertivirga mongoliensis]|uniref:Fasciclin domain-containing protein n=1 Tax=Paradesertivirga mongoliensis TaxID=2100740 RepID=A0ABW4ZLJ2_9SPHI|nr:fasciclin domain-containing protein [Pedobacter mongoliensis]
MIRFLRKEDYPYRVFLLFFLLFSFAGCNKNFDEYWSDGSTKGGNLYEKIKKTPEFSMFTEALDHSGLTPFLIKGGSYTVFAPTNEAFTKYLSASGYSSVKDVPVAELFSICSYHVVQSMWYYYDLRDRYTNPLNKLYSQKRQYLTRNRKFVDIDASVAGVFKINNLEIVKSLQDMDADNGVIHGIPEVMVPLKSLEEIISSDPEIANSTFGKMMKVLRTKTIDRENSFDKDRNGTIDTAYIFTYPLLNSGANIAVEYKAVGNTVANSQGGTPAFTTILIPNNQVLDAFIAPAMAKVDNKIDSLSPSYIEEVLENYFLSDTVMTAEGLKNRRVGANLHFLSNGYEMLSTTLRSDADFGRKDIRASNGIIHFINSTFRESPRQLSALGKAMIEPEFKLYFAAMQKTNLINTYAINNRGNTYMMPDNAAMRAARIDVEKQLLGDVYMSINQFANLMRHQIVSSNLNKAGLTGAKAAEFGGNLTFSNGGNTVTNAANNVASVGPQLYSGTPNNTGYAYRTDKLLIPAALQ